MQSLQNDESFCERTDPIGHASRKEAGSKISKVEPVNAAVDGVRALLFDYSGVMTTNLGLPPGELPCDGEALATEMLGALANQVVDHPWYELERGETSLDAFISYMESVVPGSGFLFDAASPLNAMATLELLDDRVDLVRSLSERGYAVALVTNNVAEWQPLWKPRLPPELFSVVIDSSAVGFRKPEAGIYQAALDELGVAASEAVFIDDFEWNLVGAANLGMQTIHCTGETNLAAAIEALL